MYIYQGPHIVFHHMLSQIVPQLYIWKGKSFLSIAISHCNRYYEEKKRS